MPADALSRVARRYVKANLCVSSATMTEALPQKMSYMHWKFEQSQDPICKIIKAWILEQKSSPSPVVQNILKLFGPKSYIDKENGLLYIYSEKSKRMATKCLWVPSRLQSMILQNHHGSSLGGHWKEERTYEWISLKFKGFSTTTPMGSAHSKEPKNTLRPSRTLQVINNNWQLSQRHRFWIPSLL